MSKLTISVEETLKNSDLRQVSLELSEVVFDSFLDEGIFREIPVIGTLVGVGKAGVSIRDRLFIKKLVSFLSGISDIDSEERSSVITEIESSEKYKTKVGEKLLYIIDQCDDNEKARYVACFFARFLKREITYGDFLKASSIVEKIFIDDLSYFVRSTWEHEELENISNLLHTGLVELASPDILVEDQEKPYSSQKYVVRGSQLSVYISDIGKLIRDTLSREFRIT